MSVLEDVHPDHTFTRDSMLRDPRLSLFQKVLLITDGSVTELLCLYTGQRIRARKLEQSVRRGEAPPALRWPADAVLLQRRILLEDASTSHVYAESTFLFERLSARAREMLIDTDVPIGVLWKEEKTEMYREVVDLRLERNPCVAAHFGVDGDLRLLSRTYLLHQGGSPLGLITEKFPVTSFVR